MSNFKKALYFACEKHDGQYRRGGNVPYVAHPVLVTFTIRKYTDDENILCAALLHDVIEDCPDVSIDLLKNEFGNQITELVTEVSFVDNKNCKTWKEKKESEKVSYYRIYDTAKCRR